jgi:hypothetical protein
MMSTQYLSGTAVESARSDRFEVRYSTSRARIAEAAVSEPGSRSDRPCMSAYPARKIVYREFCDGARAREKQFVPLAKSAAVDA